VLEGKSERGLERKEDKAGEDLKDRGFLTFDNNILVDN
jgi:hypothetical protein